jgi:integrase
VSAIEIPGLDVQERSPGTFRVRVRIHPFFALTATRPSEAQAVHWGCGEIARLHALHKRLTDEHRLPKQSLTRERARELGLEELIDAAIPSVAAAPAGTQVLLKEVLGSYMELEGKELSAGYFSRARRLTEYFGSMTIADVSTQAVQEYVDARLAGKLGAGRSQKAAYATRNREYQKNRRRKALGVPVVPREKCSALPTEASVRHELKLLRQALKAYANRSDERRRVLGVYVLTHPILAFPLPSMGAPRKRRISDEELEQILRRLKCPKKRAAILLGIYTSLRRSEITSLRGEDIDWAAKIIHLRRPTEPDPQRAGAVRPKRKTKTTERDVPLVPEALELLQRIAPANGPIFPFAASSLTQAFGRAAELAGVADVRVHDGRRESLSWLHEVHGLTLEQLTVFSGHTEVKTLERHYFQPSASRLANSIATKTTTRRMVPAAAA